MAKNEIVAGIVGRDETKGLVDRVHRDEQDIGKDECSNEGTPGDPDPAGKGHQNRDGDDEPVREKKREIAVHPHTITAQ